MCVIPAQQIITSHTQDKGTVCRVLPRRGLRKALWTCRCASATRATRALPATIAPPARRATSRIGEAPRVVVHALLGASPLPLLLARGANARRAPHSQAVLEQARQC